MAIANDHYTAIRPSGSTEKVALVVLATHAPLGDGPCHGRNLARPHFADPTELPRKVG